VFKIRSMGMAISNFPVCEKGSKSDHIQQYALRAFTDLRANSSTLSKI
jgi:hypothetical protein